MRFITVLIALLFALSLSATTVRAQGKGNGQAKKTTAGSQATKVKTHGPKAGKTSANASVPKPAHDTKHTAKADAHAAKKAAKASTTSVVTSTTPTTVVTPTTPTTTSVKNPKLEARLQGMLPPGTAVQDAKLGFKNWGQFVAAVHVSNNLGLPFDQLKSLMTGTATTSPMSLGQAIQTLKGATSIPPSTRPEPPAPPTTRPEPPAPSTARPEPPAPAPPRQQPTTAPSGDRPTPPTATSARPASSSGSMSSTRIKAEVKKAEDAARADLRRTRETS